MALLAEAVGGGEQLHELSPKTRCRSGSRSWGLLSRRRGLLLLVRGQLGGLEPGVGPLECGASRCRQPAPRLHAPGAGARAGLRGGRGGPADGSTPRPSAARPLLSGWVDRSKALPHAERALAIAPEHPGNHLLLALTLLDLYPERRAEALGSAGAGLGGRAPTRDGGRGPRDPPGGSRAPRAGARFRGRAA